MLTIQQKRDIIKYITGWSTKAIMEDVKSVDCDEEGIWEDVEKFLDECAVALKSWTEINHVQI